MKIQNLWDVPIVRHRFQVALHALIHDNKSATARKFNHARKTVRRYIERFEEYKRSGDLSTFLNKPRGDNHRTPRWIEDWVVECYLEEDTERTCPNIARELGRVHEIPLTRQTIRNILIRRGVWEPTREQTPIIRFEKDKPNALWQVDLIEQAKTDIGRVYGLVVVDDHSRYLITLHFLFTKEAEGVLHALYLAFCRYGLPTKILCDKGSQFYSTFQGSLSRFQKVMDRLGVEVEFTSRPQTKGKVEKLIQFIERDFLAVYRHRVSHLQQLNEHAEGWRQGYNRRPHEGIHTYPQQRYQPSSCKVGKDALWEAFAQEERSEIAPSDGGVANTRCPAITLVLMSGFRPLVGR
ncbi:MAG: DDE-type integrase/transposase/recombinase [Chloroflexota bacterium]|nr:DDE-type integrase/transposase/recombinase [Chloroflexota bacterium]